MSIFFLGLTKELLELHKSFEKRANKSKETSDTGIVKQAFDTRRINSEEQVNPRRNLQNYQRSEPFISEDVSNNIKLLFKVKNASDQIKNQFVGDPDWLDSNSRILCNAIDATLRIEQRDYDFFKPQFDYLNELLYLRYRLASEDIEKFKEEEIKNILLKKDEKLMYKSIFANYNPTESKTINKQINQPIVQPVLVSTGAKESEESLTEKLFGNVKASKENKSVQRSINIIIKDSILDDDTMEIKRGNKKADKTQED